MEGICLFVFCFLGPHLRHMEVPTRGPIGATAAGLHHSHSNAGYKACDLHHNSWECQILNPLSEARDQTHNFGVPVVAQWLTNPTRNHEVLGLIPGLAQWVKDPALPGAVV